MIRSTLAAALVLAVPLAGQTPEIGGFSGLLLGGFTGNQVSSFRPGLTIGPTVTVPVTSWLTVQSGMTYSGFSVGWAAPTPASATLRQITVPMVARFDVALPVGMPVRMSLLAGAYGSYMLQCRVSVGDGSCSQPANALTPFANMGTYDGGPIAGVGVSANLFNAFSLGTEVRYQQGLREVGVAGGGLHQRAWSIAFRVAALTGVPTQSYLDVDPYQGTLPNHQVPANLRRPNR